MALKDADIASLMAKLYAVTGCPLRGAEREFETLADLRSAEYLLLLDQQGGYLTEAAHVFRSGTAANEAWMLAPDTAPAFAIHITEVHGRVTGDAVKLDNAQFRHKILKEAISPSHIEAVTKEGGVRSYSMDEWAALPQAERDNLESWGRRFKYGDLEKIRRVLDEIRYEHDESARPITEDAFLAESNAAYMGQAQNPQPNMLRVSQQAAGGILARGGGEVFRLLPFGMEKLSPVDAVKGGGLCGMDSQVFAIWRDNTDGFDQWAKHSVKEIYRRIDRGEQDKSRGAELI